MKTKTSELIGVGLDWAVGAAVGERVKVQPGITEMIAVRLADTYQERYSPSTNWSQGGPLIERYCIEVAPCSQKEWRAMKAGNSNIFAVSFGPTTLIAACRAIVAAKLGDEVEVPESLR